MKSKQINNLFYALCIIFLWSTISYASISWPTTPDGETSWWTIGSLMNAFTLDSGNIWIGKTPTTKLDVNGTITATSIAGIITTVSQPNITSIWTLTSLNVTWDTLIDTTTLFVDSTNNRVGIGTLTPTTTLDVSGTIKGTSLEWTITTATQANITSVWTLSSLAVTGDILVDTTTLKVDATNKRVGIGTATPGLDLDVNDDDLTHIRAKISWQTNNPSIYMLADESNNKWWLYSTAPKLELGANNSIHMTFDSLGKVWIGTTTPNDLLTIEGSMTIKEQDNSPSAPASGYWKLYSKPTDGLDEYTVLLLHSEWVSTSFEDSSTSSHTISSHWWANQTTTQKKFGSKSAYLDGNDNYLSIPDSEDFNFWNADFTIDLWVYPLASVNEPIMVHGDDTGLNRWYIRMWSPDKFHFWDFNDVSLLSTSTVPLNTWTHFAVVRSGNDWSLFINWIKETTLTSATTIPNYSRALDIWWDQSIWGWTKCTCYVDEVRISKGIARWNANFTPPTSAYSAWGLFYKFPSGTESALAGWVGSAGASSIWGTNANGIDYSAGNVGIGTTTPGYKFDVVTSGGNDASDRDIAAFWRSDAVDGEEAVLRFGKSATTGESGQIGFRFQTNTDNSYTSIWVYGDAPALNIKKGGNVGIGTTNPGAKLEVNGYTKLGTDAPSIKMKLISGSTGGAAEHVKAHGLGSIHRIQGFSTMMTDESWFWHPPWETGGNYYAVFVDSTNVYFPAVRGTAMDGNQSYRVIITYKE